MCNNGPIVVTRSELGSIHRAPGTWNLFLKVIIGNQLLSRAALCPMFGGKLRQKDPDAEDPSKLADTYSWTLSLLPNHIIRYAPQTALSGA